MTHEIFRIYCVEDPRDEGENFNFSRAFSTFRSSQNSRDKLQDSKHDPLINPRILPSINHSPPLILKYLSLSPRSNQRF